MRTSLAQSNLDPMDIHTSPKFEMAHKFYYNVKVTRMQNSRSSPRFETKQSGIGSYQTKSGCFLLIGGVVNCSGFQVLVE